MQKRARYTQKLALCAIFSCAAAVCTREAVADPPRASFPDGADVLRVLGPNARAALAAAPSGPLGALVRIPPGATAASLGIRQVAPGIGEIRGEAATLLGFAQQHPDVGLEVSPPLHLLMSSAGVWTRAVDARKTYGVDGTGTLVGVADTGIDITHPDFMDENGHTRIAWLLDLSLKPIGLHPDLEAKYGIKDDQGNLIGGAVLAASEIDQLLKDGKKGPIDDVGHGTHVASIAAGNGGGGPYIGIAPKAGLVIARVTRAGTESIDNNDLVDGVAFLFDVADSMSMPIAVNLSIGGDFGSHDGQMLWEQALASNVGATHPGHALVVAAGNSGSIVDTPIHESVRASAGSTVRVPIVVAKKCVTDPAGDTQCDGSPLSGAVQVWVALRSGANVRIGIDGPDGTWISPIDENSSLGKNVGQANSGVIFGAGQPNSPIPNGSRGAIALWSGSFPPGTYSITVDGDGTVDMFLQATGDAQSRAYFAAGVREGTINLPATSPSLIGVGCTVNRITWTSIARVPVSLRVPLLDAAGGYPAPNNQTVEISNGDVCWFSSAGPTVTGVPKPEISAPGGVVVAAMSAQAPPGVGSSIFTNPNCPVKNGTKDPRCMQVDDHHGVAVGTSMSAPMAAGAAALLFQRDPTLTQDAISVLLQAGAHPFRGGAPFEDQGGPGELDVKGSLDAYDQLKNPALSLPALGASWVTLSSDYAAADGSTPVTAILELRTDGGAHRADLLDPSRLVASVAIDGAPTGDAPAIARRAPGVYVYQYTPPPGLGGSSLTLGATFDGQPIVAARTIPIAADIWTGTYSSRAKGGCTIAREKGPDSRFAWCSSLAVLALALGRRRARVTPG